MSSNQTRDRATNGVPVERWVARPADGDEAEDRLASLLRAAEPPGGLGTVGRARVWARLRQRPTSRVRTARLRWSVGLGVLLTSGVVLAAFSARRWLPANPGKVVPAAVPEKPRVANGMRRLAGPPPRPAPIENAPSPVEAALPETDRAVPRAQANIAPHASRARGRIVATPPAGSTDPATPAAASALSGETPMLGEALTRLRQNHDPGGALATLDEYRVRYPEGTFKREAEGARIDALLLLGRNDEALAELRALSLQPVGRDQELRLIRGELSAVADCGRAVADFDRVLAERAAEPFAERALHGRAVCRLRLGDETGAMRDLSEYVRRFPEGRFAAEARRTLAGRREGL